MTQILFGVFLCSAVILGEKVVVQMIAYTFHQQTYQDRMHRQEFEIKTLVTLCEYGSVRRSRAFVQSDS